MEPKPILPEIDLREVSVPLARTVAVATGPVPHETVETLEALGYDQAPVLDGGRCVGIVPSAHLRALLDADTPLSANDPGVRRTSVAEAAVVHIGDLLGAFAGERAVLTLGADGEATGMVTISDLNRHAVRKALYDLLADVEARLATLLDDTLDDPFAALKHLGERDQIALLGHYHFMKRGGVELSLLAGATLSQLITITEKHAPTLERLGYTRKVFEGLRSGLPNLRNDVMHPVRPLFYQQDQVAQVLGRVERASEVRGRLHRALSEMPRHPLL